MKLTKIRLGDHIKRISNKNSDGKIGIDKYISVSEEKVLQPSNKPRSYITTDPTQYKIATFGQFVFRPVVEFGKGLSGGRLYQDVAIFSSIYEVFEVDSEELDPEYLMLLMSTVEFDKHVDRHASGTAYRYFRFKDISAVHFKIPSLENQRKVVSTFQKLNRLIDLKLQTINQLHEIGNNIFRSQFCTVDSNSFLQLKRIGEQLKLGDVAKIKLGKEVASSRDKFTLVQNKTKERPYPAFSNSIFQDFINGFVECYDDIETVVTVDKIMGAIKIRYQKSFAVNAVNVIDCNVSKCLPEFLFFYLNNTHINKTGTTTSRQMVTAKTLLKHKLYLPTLEVQQKFAEQVKPLLKLAEQCAYDLYELRQLRKAWLTDFRPELLAKAAV